MTTYGLLSTGFSPKTYTVIKTELEDALKGVFGQSIDLAPQGPFGQLIGILAEREAELWDQAQEVYASFDPDEATGSALNALSALTGTLRNAATHSTVTVTCTGTAGTVIPEGTQFSVQTTGVKFETLAEATMSGTFTTVDVECQSVDTGPLVALAGTLTVIENPVDGLSSVTNALDAEVGSDEETDAELRLRREEELRTNETGSLEAIREAVLDVDDVDQAIVFENTSMITDGDGLPPKSIECVVSGGTAANIREAIFGSVAAGIETYGTTSGTVVDSMGISHTVKYTAATEIPVYVSATITYDAEDWPTDGSTQALDAILAFGDALVMGRDVIANAVGAPVFSISGVLNCVVLVGTSNPPGSTSVSIGIRQLAMFDSSRTTIVATPGTP